MSYLTNLNPRGDDLSYNYYYFVICHVLSLGGSFSPSFTLLLAFSKEFKRTLLPIQLVLVKRNRPKGITPNQSHWQK